MEYNEVDCFPPIEPLPSQSQLNNKITVNQKMNLDSRYQGFLCDLLSLFEELTLRSINQKPIDFDKFKHYFNIFYDRMATLETSFHQSKLKYTKSLSRLKNQLSLESQNISKLQQKQPFNTFNRHSQCASNVFTRSISAKKPSQISKELISIREEDDQHQSPHHNKRSETASGYRSISYIEQPKPVRPKTGQTSKKGRYFEASKTINVTPETYLISSETTSNDEAVNYVLNQKQIISKRRHFYEQLEKSKNTEAEQIGLQQYKNLFRKSRNYSTKKWTKKICRFL